MSDEVGLGELITQYIDYKQEGVNTAIPAIILAVKEEGRQLLVDVQPSVSIVAEGGVVVAQASILNVPMQQPASSVAGMVFPVAVGDTVLLVFSQRAIDTWKYGSGSPTAPSDARKFNRKDCVAIPCIFPTSKSVANENRQGPDYAAGDVAIYNKKGGASVEIILKQSGDIIINSPGKVKVNCVDSEVNASSSVTYNTQDFTVNSSSFKVSTGNYSVSATSTATTTGTFSMNGSYILNGIAMETHGHIEQGDGNRVSDPVA